ncbi:quinone reductase [Rhizodiscina lignyota]|uniref:Quinone reductase n=1 Tax=Rhizodiscina lignyota TaxID=1504668 RepID=A0A9P4INU7_9PEZI|nr:quinone reductase [Rhizodiscina lignyota]
MANKAAWLMAKQAKPFKVDEALMPVPGDDEVVIRNHAVGINAADILVQQLGIIYQKYPKVIGVDVAGEVTTVGEKVIKFKPGDRVLAWIKSNMAEAGSDGAFQLFAKTSGDFVCKIPDDVPFKNACVMPQGMGTASMGLFAKEDGLGLPYPQVPPKPTGEVIVVWAGATSVGSCAIQLAVAAGLEVASTASERNHEYCKNLGAKWVFDYKSETVVDDILKALEGKTSVGVMDAWSRDPFPGKSAELAMKLKGNSFLQTVFPSILLPKEVPEGLTLGHVSGMHADVVSAVWGDWMPKALAAGTLKCAPEPLVVGQGLEEVQTAFDHGAFSTSAQKLVVELP